ncbi:MAG: Ig-like domain-containing protein, partial [Bacteroidales bacterium]|nr:Ig-like domain-containing protein [Bacteroidales bacterium]
MRVSNLLSSIAVSVLLCTSCFGILGLTEEPTDSEIAVENIEIQPSQYGMTVGEMVQLKVVLTPENASQEGLVWSVETGPNDPKGVVSVDEYGIVTALAPGFAHVAATIGEVKAIAFINVSEAPVYAEEIKLDTTRLTMHIGEMHTIIASVLPEEAQNNSVEWKSFVPSVATVDWQGTVTAVGYGIAILRASIGTDIYSECSVRVVRREVSSVSVQIPSTELTVGQQQTATVDVQPESAREENPVEWKSSNTAVATVGADGQITAVGEGSAFITAYAGSKSASCKVTVSPAYVAVESLQVSVEANVELLPGEICTAAVTCGPAESARFNTCEWKSSDETVATVNTGGKVVAVAKGSAVISATAGGQTVSFTVNVPDITRYGVDIGASVLWGMCNLGATSPEQSGIFVAWGETAPKAYYSWDSYRWCKKKTDPAENEFKYEFTKYVDAEGWGVLDNDPDLEPADDPVVQTLGDGWRMPTSAEMYELLDDNYFVWEKVTIANGVVAWKVTSKFKIYEGKWGHLQTS